PGSDINWRCSRVSLKNYQACFGQIINIYEFTLGAAGTPNGYGLRATDFRFVEAPYKSGDDMTVLRVVVVPGSKHVGGHNGHKIGPVLSPVSPAELNPRDLRNSVPF